MPRKDLIASKIERVLNPMIDDLKKNKKALARVGGFTVEDKDEEVKMQEERKANLLWANDATDQQIRTRIKELEQSITAEALACKYGIVRGLPLETVKVIAMIEDLEIALGTHPAVVEREGS